MNILVVKQIADERQYNLEKRAFPRTQQLIPSTLALGVFCTCTGLAVQLCGGMESPRKFPFVIYGNSSYNLLYLSGIDKI